MDFNIYCFTSRNNFCFRGDCLKYYFLICLLYTSDAADEGLGVDLVQSDRGPLVLEVNSSPGLEGIESASDIDVAKEIISFLEKKVENTDKSKPIDI